MKQIPDQRNILPAALYIACRALSKSMDLNKIAEVRNSLLGEAILQHTVMDSEEKAEFEHILSKLFGDVDKIKLG